MWYGIGNTALANPSTLRIVLSSQGRLVFYNGAVDIGQGSNTTLTQVAADALGLPMAQFELVMGDTDRTADAGKILGLAPGLHLGQGCGTGRARPAATHLRRGGRAAR